MRFGFIHNSRARHGRQTALVEAAIAALRAHGHDACVYECPAEPAEPVARAVKDGCDVVVACGGDGTVNGVASAIRGSKAVLAVFPLGTLNHFARDLGIHGIAQAERVLLDGHVREIDAGLVNGHLFVNNSGIGIYPSIVQEREMVRKSGIPKWPAFVVACIRALAKLPFLRLGLEADGHHLRRTTPFLFVGNNLYTTEGFAIGRRNRLDAGVLAVCAARHQGPWGLIKIAFRALFATVRRDRDFTLVTAKRLTVRAQRRKTLRVSLDGEVRRMKTPLEYSVVPRALRVLAP